MKTQARFIITIFMILFIIKIQAQDNTVPIFTLDGAIGLTFGMTQEQARPIIEKKGGKIDLKNSDKDEIIFDDVTFAIRKTEFVRLSFINNRLFGISAYFMTLEAKTQELFDDIHGDLSVKYGSGHCKRDFKKGIYSDGDGYEMQAVRTGNAEIECWWTIFENKNAISLVIAENLMVKLTYMDGVLLDEKVKELNKVKSSDL